MNQLILYSAVGGTDPISNFRDASLLHICRVYKPDKVVILMSKEMIAYHNKDNRYCYCLEKLGEKLNHPFDIELIQKGDLVDVQDFDVVYPIISQNLKDILSSMDKTDKLIVNIASGTPAMKYCLQFLSALADYNFVPISVKTPEKSINPHIEDRNNYNPQDMWEANEDNDDSSFVNRCQKTTSLAMLSEFYKHTLVKFIHNYDYSAAVTFVESVNCFSDDVKKLLNAGHSRLQLDIGKSQHILKSYGFDFPYNDDRKLIFEYALALGIKIKKKDYADFVRAITPLMTELLIKSLMAKCNINIDDYTVKSGTKILWNENKLMNTELENLLQTQFSNFHYGVVFNSHLREIIKSYVLDGEFGRVLDKLNDFEEKTRNLAAHNMVSITSEKIRKDTGLSPEQIYNEIKKFLPMVNIPVNGWDSYDKMNELIISKL